MLEARDRVGGRVWSRELPNGAVIELGAEFILPRQRHDPLLRRSIRARAVGQGHALRASASREAGSASTRKRLHDALDDRAACARDRGHGERPGLGAGRSSTGCRSTRVPWRRSRRDSRCRARRRRIGSPPRRSPASPHTRTTSRRASRAATSASPRRCRRSSASGVHLSTPVRRDRWDGRSDASRAGDRELTADRVVLAVPASVIGRIEFRAGAARASADGIRPVEYGHAAKLFVALDAPPEPSAVLSVPERYWTWTATGADGVQPVVSALRRVGARAPSARRQTADRGNGSRRSSGCDRISGSRSETARALHLGRRSVGRRRLLVLRSRPSPRGLPPARSTPAASTPRGRGAHSWTARSPAVSVLRARWWRLPAPYPAGRILTVRSTSFRGGPTRDRPRATRRHRRVEGARRALRRDGGLSARAADRGARTRSTLRLSTSCDERHGRRASRC